MTLTRDVLGQYLALDRGRIDEIAIRAAHIALADGLAVMVAATGLESAVRPFIDFAAASGVGPSTLIGEGRKVSPVQAALANGALAHAIDFEDTFEEGMIHPNASLIPAVLALAESEGSDGEAVLSALALGCDFACRLSLALDGDPAQRGWYHPPILSGLGATLGCAVLLGLDADKSRNALGLFAVQFMLGDELKRSPHSDLRAVREGLAARAAVESVLLARAGVEAVEQPLEGPSGVFRLLTGNDAKAEVFEGIGERFLGPEVGVKRWPACRGTHSAIAAAQNLREQGVRPDDIVRVGVEAIPPNDMLFVPRDQRVAPQTAIDGKFSIPFVFAAALAEGDVTLASFSAARLAHEPVLALARRVHLDGMLPRGGHEAAYTVTLANGDTIKKIVEVVPVWCAREIALGDLAAKVTECLGVAHQPVDTAAFLGGVEALGTSGAGPLMALLRRSA